MILVDSLYLNVRRRECATTWKIRIELDLACVAGYCMSLGCVSRCVG